MKGRTSEFRPAPYWWLRWLGYVWQKFQRSGGFSNDLLRPLVQSYLNILLVFLPLAVIAAVNSFAPDVVFILNFLAIIPVSGLVLLACEDLSASWSPGLGRFFVAFMNNLVELVVSETPDVSRQLVFIDSAQVGIVALCKGEIHLVRLSVIGSVLCYSLLVSNFILASCRRACC